MQQKLRHSLLCLTALAVFSAAAPAQTTVVRNLLRYKVTPGRTGDFQAAIKDYNETLKKAGWPRAQTMWASLTGPREFVFAGFAPNYADFDNVMSEDPKMKEYGSQMTAIVARFMGSIESWDRVIDQVLPEYSILSNETPKMLRVVRVVVKPDHVTDYLALVKSELLPAAKQSGTKFFYLSQTRLGGLGSEFRLMVGIDKWADLDQVTGSQKAMGDEKWAEFMKKYRSLIVETQVDLYRYQPDLSYIPAPAK